MQPVHVSKPTLPQPKRPALPNTFMYQSVFCSLPSLSLPKEQRSFLRIRGQQISVGVVSDAYRLLVMHLQQHVMHQQQTFVATITTIGNCCEAISTCCTYNYNCPAVAINNQLILPDKNRRHREMHSCRASNGCSPPGFTCMMCSSLPAATLKQ